MGYISIYSNIRMKFKLNYYKTCANIFLKIYTIIPYTIYMHVVFNFSSSISDSKFDLSIGHIEDIIMGLFSLRVK